MQDLGGGQDDHAEKYLEESPRCSGQDVHVFRCPLEQDLLGRRESCEDDTKRQSTSSF
jgi:hypothetical protein